MHCLSPTAGQCVSTSRNIRTDTIEMGRNLCAGFGKLNRESVIVTMVTIVTLLIKKRSTIVSRSFLKDWKTDPDVDQSLKPVFQFVSEGLKYPG